MSGWTTHRGDEWWYEGAAIRASAGSGANIVSIGEIEGTKGHFTEAEFHRFLEESLNLFSGSRILISLNSSSVENTLQSLHTKGLVSFEVMASKYSKEAKLQSLAPFAEQPSTGPAKNSVYSQ